MVRSLAVLTILFLTSSTLYSSGWFCIPVLGNCCATASADRCLHSAPDKIARSCSSPFSPESQSSKTTDPCAGSCECRCGSKNVVDCGNTEDIKCITKIAGTLEPECQPAVLTGQLGFPTACYPPDNTRCARKADSPRDCEPARCFLIHPLLAAPPPKAPASIDAPALQPLDQQPWVECSQVSPTSSPPRATDPIIETTVLRI